MGIYNHLDIVISEYVGYKDNDSDKCADPVLHESITNECTKHIREELAYDKLSKDAQYCISEWESILQHSHLI